MITKGNITSFSFYVTAFDTKNSYRNYGEAATQLSLEQAKAEFAKRCAQNPLSVNTVLGVDYSTNRLDLEPHGTGSADLLQCVNGHLELSDDYKLSNSGLVYGNHSDIHDRSAEIKTEILRHNDLENEGLAADDQLSL